MLITADEHSRGKLTTLSYAGTGPDDEPVRFSLVPSAASALFTLYARSGVLKVRDPALLDYETQDSFDLTVLVKIGRGRDKRTEEIKLTVRLNDILEEGETRLIQKADIVSGLDLGKVSAAGGVQYVRVFHEDSGSGRPSSLFQITDGRLVIKDGADPAAGRYALTLMSRDGRDKKTVTIDVNEVNAPVMWLRFHFEDADQTQRPDLVRDLDGDSLTLADTQITTRYGRYVIRDGEVTFTANSNFIQTAWETLHLPVTDSRGGEGFVEVVVRITGLNIITGTNGRDVLTGTHLNDRILGEASKDVIDGGRGDDELYGGKGSDVITGGEGEDLIYGELGHDRLSGGAGRDVLYGGDGDDVLNGGSGADKLDGGTGYDVASYAGTAAPVQVNLATGEAGGGAAGDSLSGIEGLIGGYADDVLTGDDADNFLSGNEKSDVLYGGGGNDILIGGKGNDILSGGAGADLLVDSSGSNIFVLELADGSRAQDTVVSFRLNADVPVNFEHLLKYRHPDYWREEWFWADSLQVTLDLDDPASFDYTLSGLMAAVDIRWTNDSNVADRPDTDVASRFVNIKQTNDPDVNDTVFFYTHGTADTADDEIVMVLEDFTKPIDIDMFSIVIL